MCLLVSFPQRTHASASMCVCVLKCLPLCVCAHIFVALLQVFASAPRLIRVKNNNNNNNRKRLKKADTSHTSVSLFCSLHC